MLGHFGWRWLRQTFPSENFLHTHSKHVDPEDCVPKLPVKGSIFGIQVRLLVLQDILQALSYKKQATLNIWPMERRVLLDLELREARGPSAEVLPIGFVLDEKTNSQFNWKIFLAQHMKVWGLIASQICNQSLKSCRMTPKMWFQKKTLVLTGAYHWHIFLPQMSYCTQWL